MFCQPFDHARQLGIGSIASELRIKLEDAHRASGGVPSGVRFKKTHEVGGTAILCRSCRILWRKTRAAAIQSGQRCALATRTRRPPPTRPAIRADAKVCRSFDFQHSLISAIKSKRCSSSGLSSRNNAQFYLSDMPHVHFVEDYERLVAELMASHPLDEAMSLAVGGEYDRFGALQADLLTECGLRDGMSLVDLGCGSGRAAKHLGQRFPKLGYTGIDIIQALLDYARQQSPAHFQFIKHQEVSIPLASASADFVIAFSLFTHLLHEESYLYMADTRRVLKPQGKLVLSFLEFGDPGHWFFFENTVAIRKANQQYPLNCFIEQSVIRLWAGRLGFDLVRIGPSSLGQSFAVLAVPAPMPAEAVQGFLDVCEDGQIAGWAWDPSDPERRLDVDIIVDDRLLARVKADKHRPDLEAAGIGDGAHGFLFELPRTLDLRRHRVEVAASGTRLSRSRAETA